MRHKVNIIGAGVTGLCTGCYLQMNGYETEIFELHTLPGGLCTSWKRSGYTFDGCIHWLVGSSPADDFYYLWDELLDMKKMAFVDHEEYIRVEDEQGRFIRVFTDLDRLEAEMLEKAPEDAALIKTFTKGTRKLLKLKMPVDKAPQVMNPLDGLKLIFKMLPYLGTLKKWSAITAQDYADRCQNPLLKKTFEMMFLPQMAMVFLLMTMVWMHRKSAGYPLGGSLAFARLLEASYLGLGGKIHYRSRVEKIITEDNRAAGIVLDNGQTLRADTVISAADGHDTIFHLLEGRYLDEKIKNYYDSYELFPSFIQVSLGVGKTLPNAPATCYFPLDQPLVLDNETRLTDIGFRVFNFDPGMAPPGKTAVVSVLPTTNDRYWVDLRRDNLKKYQAEKERIATAVIGAFTRKYGVLASDIETVDVSTPATVIRYTNNWRGSLEGWVLTPRIGLKQMPKVLPGLANFYMVGQWVEPGGGLPTCILSGRNVTQMICKRDKKKFQVIPRSPGS